MHRRRDARKALTDIKTTRLKSDAYQTPDEDKNKKGKFDAVVDSLIKGLDVAIA